MAENTAIEWTATRCRLTGELIPGHSWSPWWGCVEISPACDHCYAAAASKRYGFDCWGTDTARRELSDGHWQKPFLWDRKAANQNIRRKVFPSMCDPFEHRTGWYGEQMNRLRGDFWKLIESTPNLDWLLLTKRPQNIMRMIPEGWRQQLPPNVWIGATVEDRARLWRVDHLRSVPAVLRFISAEPLLEDLGQFDLSGIHWVIGGGESGRLARPTETEAARSLRDHVIRSGAFFFWKQWGEYLGALQDGAPGLHQITNPLVDRSIRAGKKKSGALLDGVEWKEIPVYNHRLQLVEK